MSFLKTGVVMRTEIKTSNKRMRRRLTSVSFVVNNFGPAREGESCGRLLVLWIGLSL